MLRLGTDISQGEYMGNKEREELKKAYPNSKKWAEKVDKMTPDQVTAIYIRLRAARKLGK